MAEGELTKESWYDKAIQLRDAGKIDDALSELEQLVMQYPDYPLAHLALAVFYSKSERFEESIDEARRACELESENPFYFTAASSLAIKGGHRAEAEEALLKAQKARFDAQMKKMNAEDVEGEQES